MKSTLLICCILALVLIGLSYAPEDALSVSATLVENGVMIENAGNVDCLVFVSSPEGEQRFELAIGESITVNDISQPIEVSAVTL